jgi:hypothetical protein
LTLGPVAAIARLGKKRALEVAAALINEAAQGNVFAFKELADRTEGKVADRLEVSGAVDLGLRIAAARQRLRLAATNNNAVANDLAVNVTPSPDTDPQAI